MSTFRCWIKDTGPFDPFRIFFYGLCLLRYASTHSPPVVPAAVPAEVLKCCACAVDVTAVRACACARACARACALVCAINGWIGACSVAISLLAYLVSLHNFRRMGELVTTEVGAPSIVLIRVLCSTHGTYGTKGTHRTGGYSHYHEYSRVLTDTRGYSRAWCAAVPAAQAPAEGDAAAPAPRRVRPVGPTPLSAAPVDTRPIRGVGCIAGSSAAAHSAM